MAIAQAKRFTLDEYHKLAEIGFFHEDSRIELIKGEIIQMAAKGTAYETSFSKIMERTAQISWW